MASEKVMTPATYPDMKVKTGKVEVTGGQVWYRIAGYDKPGIPLITIHGGPGMPHDTLETLDALADERPVIYYDQLGCGRSDPVTDTALMTVDRFVDEVAMLRDALGLEEVHILALSWGTIVATEYMLTKKPRGVKSVVLSGPCLSAPKWEADTREYLNELSRDMRKVITECEDRCP